MVRCRATIGIVLLSLWLGLSATAQVEMSLAEALEALREQGIETVYSNRWVTPDLRVDALPAEGLNADRLAELLDPFDLRAHEIGPDLWIVGRKPPSAEGRVSADPGGENLPGAQIRVLPSGPVAFADSDGRFRLPDLAYGTHTIELDYPGFQTERRQIQWTEDEKGPFHFGLRLEDRWTEELWVSESPPRPNVGTTAVSRGEMKSRAIVGQDPTTAVAGLPGIVAENGVRIGIRGHDPEELTVVVDGVELVEPYHLRDLGGLAAAVTPEAIAEAKVHRGSAPLTFGDQAGGVLELKTEDATNSLSLRLGVGTEVRQSALHTLSPGGSLALTGAVRSGSPEPPSLLGQFSLDPSYDDFLIKASWRGLDHHSVLAEWLGSFDTFPYRQEVPGYSIRLNTQQEADHGWIRYQGIWRRWLSELTAYDIEARRSRDAIHAESAFYAQEDGQLHPGRDFRSFELDDRRWTDRRGLRGGWSLDIGDRLEAQFGFDARDESTRYQYDEHVTFKIVGPDGEDRIQELSTVVDDSRTAMFTAFTWRPTATWTVDFGWRGDRSSANPGTHGSPRLALAWARGRHLVRFQGTRAQSLPETHELQIADNLIRLPTRQATDLWALEYRFEAGRSRLTAEVFGRWVDDPRPRYENLFKPVSQFPELEIDRILVSPESGRGRGVELSFERDWKNWRLSTAYTHSKIEDQIDGRWLPRRTDYRHGASLSLIGRPAEHWTLAALWSGRTGGPTTPFDIDAGRIRFADGLGDYHSERLPDVHRLDLRVGCTFQFRILSVTLEGAIDNAYDRRPVRGFALLALDDPTLDRLPQELGLGRQLRWGVTLAWTR